MNAKKQYTKDDLTLGTSAIITRENGIITHSHLVEFGRPLTEAERHLFRSVLTGFYHTVRFSGQFGGEFIAEPWVEFVGTQTARYTFRQLSLNDSWKDLLFAILTWRSQNQKGFVTNQHEFSRRHSCEFVKFVTKNLCTKFKLLADKVLTNFSLEIVPIVRHDESRAFAPERMQMATD